MKNFIKIRVDELEVIFNDKIINDRFFIRATLITNLKILSIIDIEHAELYILRIRELGYRGKL